MTTEKADLPVRVGVFQTIEAAEQAVRELVELGFDKEQISVICSDEHKERHFPNVSHPPIPGTNTVVGILTGGVVGASIGGILLAASAVVTGGATLLTAGPLLVGGGAIAGSFTGAMATRGFETEVANYYDQAVQRGDILVGVEYMGEDASARLAEAERVLANAGATPVPLVDG